MKKMIGKMVIALIFVLYTLLSYSELSNLSKRIDDPLNSIFDKLREISVSSWKPYCDKIEFYKEQGERVYYFGDFFVAAYVQDSVTIWSKIEDPQNRVIFYLKPDENISFINEWNSTKIIARVTNYSKERTVTSVDEYQLQYRDGQYFFAEKPECSKYAEILISNEKDFLEKVTLAEKAYKDNLGREYKYLLKKTIRNEAVVLVIALLAITCISKMRWGKTKNNLGIISNQ